MVEKLAGCYAQNRNGMWRTLTSTVLRRFAAAFLGVLVFVSANSSKLHAAVIGADVVSDGNLTATGSNILGYSFELSQQVQVTGLGYFDVGANGIRESLNNGPKMAHWRR